MGRAQPKPDRDETRPTFNTVQSVRGWTILLGILHRWMRQMSSKETRRAADLSTLLRNALQLHEALGHRRGSLVLLKMGRRLRDRSLARYFPAARSPAEEMCWRSIGRRIFTFRTYFDDATHHLSLTALYEAAGGPSGG